MPSGPSAKPSESDLAPHRARIHRYVTRMVGDPVEADDLTQETFLRAHRQLDSLRDGAALSVWLYRIATNVCYDRFRQPSFRRRIVPLEPAAHEVPGSIDAQLADLDQPRLDEVAEQQEMRECVRGYVEELPEDYRMVIFLHDFQGLTNPEIARMLGLTLDVVKIRIHRARRKLEESLNAACDFAHDDRGVYVCERKLTLD